MVIIVKIYLKRDSSDFSSRYIIFDELCDEKYRILGKHIASGERMYILKGEEKVAKIRNIQFTVFRSYSITVKNETIRLIITKTGADYTVNFRGISWHIRGDIIAKSYDILDADNTIVATNCKRFSPCGDGYELNIFSDSRELFCIAIAVCIDSIAAVSQLTLQMS